MSERESQLRQIRDQLSQIAETDASKDLVRTTELGDTDFKDAVPAVEATVKLFGDIDPAGLDQLPMGVLKKLDMRASKALGNFSAIRSFTVKANSNPTRERDALVQNLQQEYEKHFQELAPITVYLDMKRTDVTTRAAQAEDLLGQLDSHSVESRLKQQVLLEEMGKRISDADAVLDTVRDVAAEAGVGQQAAVFQDQAETDRSAANRWLAAAAFFGLVSFGYVISTLFIWPPATDTTSEVFRGIGTRLVALSLLAYVLSFTARQYTSSKHNETVNLHRQNALRTFETFVQATGDQETKDAVLLEATRAIFATQPTGFLRGNSGSESPSTMIEVVRRIGSSPPRDE